MILQSVFLLLCKGYFHISIYHQGAIQLCWVVHGGAGWKVLSCPTLSLRYQIKSLKRESSISKIESLILESKISLIISSNQINIYPRIDSFIFVFILMEIWRRWKFMGNAWNMYEYVWNMYRQVCSLLTALIMSGFTDEISCGHRIW